MLQSKEVKKDIHWVGVLDPDIRVFDIIMYTEYGTTYNAYIVKGSEKTALFEVTKLPFWDEFYERLCSICDPSEIDYIVASHTEPDHSGALCKLLEIAPQATIVGSSCAIRFLKDILNRPFSSMAVNDKDTLTLGNKTLQFIMAPFLHWPDTMFTYIPEDKTIFTCDAFGCHYSSEEVFNDLQKGDFYDAYQYYFHHIMGPFKEHVRTALNKIKDLDIETICNGHGPVIRENPEKYIDMYQKWAEPEKDNEAAVCIPYVSNYGYTKKLAETIMAGLQAAGVKRVSLINLLEAEKEELDKEIMQCNGILFGSPTLVGDTLPPVWEVLSGLNPFIHKGKLAGAFGSYGWSGEAVPNIEGRLKQLRFKMPLQGLRVVFNPSEEDLKAARQFGLDFGQAVCGQIKNTNK